MHEDLHARLTIFGLPTMKKPAIKVLVRWLRRIADEIEKENDLEKYNAKHIMRLFK